MTTVKSKEIVCSTDKEYEDAKALQAKYNTLDPNHEIYPRIIVIDYRFKY